jgi:ADP-ribosylglycohydrolase
MDALERARISVEGLSLGDAFGVYYRPTRLLSGTWNYTDDTMMALSIIHILRQHGKIDQDALVMDFAVRYNEHRNRGYGPGMHRLLPAILSGQSWQEASKALFRGMGSFGNGGAMRIGPLGAFFADDLPKVVEQARLATEVTHAHPEGIAGGIAIAVGAAVAWQARGSKLTRAEFIDRVLPHIPDSEVKNRVKIARDTEFTAPRIAALIDLVGNGHEITAQDTVAFCLWCAGEKLDAYDEAVKLAASGQGDIDTVCAIVGGMVACYTGIEGIPKDWLDHREALPGWPFGK